MASFEFSNAQYLANPWLASEVMNSAINIFEPMEKGYLKFIDISPAIYTSYNRVSSYGSTDAAFVSNTGSVTHSAVVFSNQTDRVLTIARQVRIPHVYQSDPVYTASQLQICASRVGKAFGDAFSSSAAPADASIQINSIYGLATAAGSSQSISGGSDGTVSGALSFVVLDKIADAVKEGPPQSRVYMMHPQTIRSYRALCRTAGVSPELIMLENFGSVLAHNGLPILRADGQETNQTEAGGVNTTRVACFQTDPTFGIFGFYNGSEVLKIVGPYNVTATVSDEYSVEMNAGLGLRSVLGVAQAKGITN